MTNYSEGSMIDQVIKKGVMRVAVNLHKPPEEGMADEYYLDPKTGKPEGVVIDYMKLMTEDLGIKPEWISIPWNEQVDALINGDVDILPKHTNTPERALRVDFADQMIAFETLIVISKDNPQTQEDLKQVGKIIACGKGSSNRLTIEKLFPQAKIVEIDEYLMGADALEKSEVDGWVESAISKNLLKMRPMLDVIKDPEGNIISLSKDYAHMAVKLGDQRSINWINNWIKFRRAQGDLKYLLDIRWPNCLVR